MVIENYFYLTINYSLANSTKRTIKPAMSAFISVIDTCILSFFYLIYLQTYSFLLNMSFELCFYSANHELSIKCDL